MQMPYSIFIRSEKNAIDPALPALPEDPEAIPEQYKISYSGTLAFEDLWYKLGDYDMNDVMVKVHQYDDPKCS